MSVKISKSKICNISVDGITVTLSIKQYAKAVLRMFDKYMHDYSIEEYDLAWNSYPIQELEKLRSQYHALQKFQN